MTLCFTGARDYSLIHKNKKVNAMAAVRWGILSSSSFAVEHIIPALKQCHGLELCAVSSRNGDTAQALAAKFGIARAHGSYQALVDDPEIAVVYNPLANDLHVPW